MRLVKSLTIAKTPLDSKEEETKMLELSWPLLLLARPKRKLNVNLKEPSTLETLSIDKRKSESSDKLREFWQPN